MARMRLNRDHETYIAREDRDHAKWGQLGYNNGGTERINFTFKLSDIKNDALNNADYVVIYTSYFKISNYYLKCEDDKELWWYRTSKS